jgi:hypothetical protein
MLEQFIAMTHNVINEDGFEDYLPTLLLPDQRKVVVLEAELDGDNQESAVYDWVANRVSGQESFLVAFKVDSNHFKVFGRLDGVSQERLCPINAAAA